MKITLLAVGKTDDSRMEQLTQMYVDRLQHYINFELEIIPDLKKTKNLSEDQQKNEEGKLILERADKMYVDDILMHSFNSIQCKTLFVPSLRILTKSYCYINTGNFSSSQSFETRVFSCYYLSSRRHPTSSLRTWRTTKWIPIAHSLS